jgi:hypothetical protein
MRLTCGVLEGAGVLRSQDTWIEVEIVVNPTSACQDPLKFGASTRAAAPAVGHSDSCATAKCGLRCRAGASIVIATEIAKMLAIHG